MLSVFTLDSKPSEAAAATSQHRLLLMNNSQAEERDVVKTDAVEIPESVVKRLDPVVLEVFSKEDFHRVDMRTIARRAGMSFTTIYRHFSDKESLLFWFIAHWLKDLQAVAIQSLAGDKETSSLVLMRNYLVAHFRFYEAQPDVGRIIFMGVPLVRWMQDSTYSYREPIRRLIAVIKAGQKAGEIRDDVTPLAIVDLLSGTFNRTFLMWEYRGRTDSLVAQADEVFSLITGGIQNSGASTRGR